MTLAMICLAIVLILAVLWALGTTDMHRASCELLAVSFALVGIGAALGALIG